MDVAAAENAAAQANLLTLTERTGLVYLVDNKVVTEAEAHAIPSARIASVEVVKSTAPGAKAHIQINTLDAGTATRRGRVGGSGFVASGGALTASTTIDQSAADTVMRFSGKLSIGGRGGAMDTTNAPLILVDGVVATNRALLEIPKGDIESVEIIKGAAARREHFEQPHLAGAIPVLGHLVAVRHVKHDADGPCLVRHPLPGRLAH